MLKTLGVSSTIRLTSWLSAWSRHDPGEAHAHLGTVAVDPDAQGCHIGHMLMHRYCESLDRIGAVGYLETDRAENVRFYHRFGFEVSATAPVLGVMSCIRSTPSSR